MSLTSSDPWHNSKPCVSINAQWPCPNLHTSVMPRCPAKWIRITYPSLFTKMCIALTYKPNKTTVVPYVSYFLDCEYIQPIWGYSICGFMASLGWPLCKKEDRLHCKWIKIVTFVIERTNLSEVIFICIQNQVFLPSYSST